MIIAKITITQATLTLGVSATPIPETATMYFRSFLKGDIGAAAPVVQDVGNNTASVMSQNASTTAFVAKATGKSLVLDTEIAKLATVAQNAKDNVIEGVSVNGTPLGTTLKVVNVIVPTTTSELTNNSAYQTLTEQAAAIQVEADARQVADTALDVKITNNTNALTVEVAARVAGDSAINTGIGDKAQLTTTAKNTIVAAINEVDASANAAIPATEKGANNGVATLGSDGRLTTAQIPGSVDQIIEVVNYAALPTTGVGDKIYITLDDHKQYRWGGSAYAEISASLALGESAGTAYEGTKGKAVTDGLAAEITNRTNAVNLKLNKAGDTMTGSLTVPSLQIVNPVDAYMVLDDGSLGALVWFKLAGANKAVITNRGGVNDLKVVTWGDDNIPHTPLTIKRVSGNIGMGVSEPTNKLEVNGTVKAANFLKGANELIDSVVFQTATDLLLPKAGGTITGKVDVTSGGVETTSVGKDGYIVMPDGGHKYFDGAQTGLVTVVLPVGRNQKSVISFDVVVRNYNSASYVEYKIKGYNTSTWTYTFCETFSDTDSANLPVRFGYNGSKIVVSIGETTTSWNSATVQIKNVSVDYQDFDYDTWSKNWNLTIGTTLPSTIDATISDYNVYKKLQNQITAIESIVEITNFDTFNPDTDVRTKDFTVGQRIQIRSFEATGRPVIDGLTYHSWCGWLMLCNVGHTGTARLWKYIVWSEALPGVETQELFMAMSVYDSGTRTAWTTPSASTHTHAQIAANTTAIATKITNPSGGLTDQVLTKTATGEIWAAPTGGSGGGTLNLVNALIGDLTTNRTITQTVSMVGDRILCDGVTKLYPAGTSGQTLFYNVTFLAFMQANFPASVDGSLVITMPQIHEDNGYELTTNSNGSAWKYSDGRLVVRGGTGDFSVTSVAQTFPSIFSEVPVVTDIYVQDAGGTASNRVFNWYIDGATNYLYSQGITTTGFNANMSTAISDLEPRYTAEGVWKTYVARYQYMQIANGTDVTKNIEGLPFREVGGDLSITGEINVVATGGVTVVNDVASGFSQTKFVNAMDTFMAQSYSSHERFGKFTTGSDITTEQHILGVTADWYGWTISIMNGKIYTLANSSGGGSWDLFVQTSTLSVLANTTYYCKWGWTGTQYYVRLSTDGTTYVDYITFNSTTKLSNSTSQYGHLASLAHNLFFLGSIDFNDAYVMIDGVISLYASFGKSISFRGNGVFKTADSNSFTLTPPSTVHFNTMTAGSYYIIASDTNEAYLVLKSNLFIQGTAPASVENSVWVDNTKVPAVSKIYLNGVWVVKNLSRCRAHFQILNNTLDYMRNHPYGIRLSDWVLDPLSDGVTRNYQRLNEVESWG